MEKYFLHWLQAQNLLYLQVRVVDEHKQVDHLVYQVEHDELVVEVVGKCLLQHKLFLSHDELYHLSDELEQMVLPLLQPMNEVVEVEVVEVLDEYCFYFVIQLQILELLRLHEVLDEMDEMLRHFNDEVVEMVEWDEEYIFLQLNHEVFDHPCLQDEQHEACEHDHQMVQMEQHEPHELLFQ